VLLMTNNPEFIRQWAMQRGGHPAKPRSQGWPRIIFTEADAGSEAISWEEFFRLFDDLHLGLAYDPAPASRECALMALAEESEEEPEAPPARKTAGEEDDETFHTCRVR
jgi:hypothetical protein